MLRKIVFNLSAVVFAFGVLLISVLRTASVRYDFGIPVETMPQDTVLGEGGVNIDYFLAYPGEVLPNSPIWPLKAARDRFWLFVTTNKLRKAEVLLLFADKRLASAQVLFDQGNYEVGYTVLTKAEKYLEDAIVMEKSARQQGYDTQVLLLRLALGSLKHYEVIQEELIPLAPEVAKPALVKSQNYPVSAYENTRDAMFEVGLTPPENPFDWD